MPFSAPCFSGQCSFCPECCKSSKISDEPEILQRANDLSKFLGKDKISHENDSYNNSLKKLIKKYDYRNPSDQGFLPNFQYYQNDKYKLIQENPHAAVCDDPLCSVFFINSHDSIKTFHYTMLPIYTRVKDNQHQLCAVCIQNEISFF